VITSNRPLLDGLDVVANMVANVVANVSPAKIKLTVAIPGSSIIKQSANKEAKTSKHGVYADKQKRREYMRSYMAKRRTK